MKQEADMLLANGEELTSANNAQLKDFLLQKKGKTAWSKIS